MTPVLGGLSLFDDEREVTTFERFEPNECTAAGDLGLKNSEALGVTASVADVVSLDAVDDADGPQTGVGAQDLVGAAHAITVLTTAVGVSEVDAQRPIPELYAFDADGFAT